jgi:hypothetical protein
MLKYILITFVFCFSTPSFCASKSFANSSLSMGYAKNEIKNKNIFSINKNALIANKLIKKKRFPIFGIGSIISFFIAILPLTNKWFSERDWSMMLLFISILTSLILGIIGLVVGEFILWSILGILLTCFLLYTLIFYRGSC